jgi:hypothetical protein
VREERRELARKALLARWAKAREKAQQKDLQDKTRSGETSFMISVFSPNHYCGVAALAALIFRSDS